MSITRPIIIISGPTCSGKSSLALQLAKDIDGVIVNGDSRQVYKEMKVGTARPSLEEMSGIPHYMYGYVSVRDSYNLFKYQKDCYQLLDSIPKEKIVILVGGTGLYIDSIVFNYILTPIVNNQKGSYDTLPLNELQRLIPRNLMSLLNESDRFNPIRLRRILEQGEYVRKKGEIRKNIYFVIDQDRDFLRRKISERVDWMIDNGLIEENRKLREDGLNIFSAIKSIGYQEFDGYFDNKKSIAEVKDEIINHTNQYAKRQRTWFRRNTNAIWESNYNTLLAESVKFIKTV